MPVLVPSRSERARLEVLLSDVWSQDVLPLPSMTNIARNERIIRRSASTVMRKLSVSSMTKRSGSLSRRTIEDPSSDDQTRQSSFSSDGGFDFSDKVGREESSHSYTTKASTLSETRELSEEDDHISDNRSPRLELTQISELEPLDLIEIISDKTLESETKSTPALQDCMTNRVEARSPQISASMETSSVTKENLSFWADVPVKSADVPWLKGKGSKNEKRCTGIRRFFR
ncbi:hypothetical protein IL306_010606 [Fusarium sp. DS 682]|nr:hypothetical protein IL306_010606 [Fusarium sp. DS 682]